MGGQRSVLFERLDSGDTARRSEPRSAVIRIPYQHIVVVDAVHCRLRRGRWVADLGEIPIHYYKALPRP